jgi:3-oxoacyl-[acyl-carrier protein] reductase
MDLGIAGRKAIVCASSRGLGRACAFALAEAGCKVVINGREAARLEATAAEIRAATGAAVPSPTSWSTTMPGRRSAIFASSRGNR